MFVSALFFVVLVGGFMLGLRLTRNKKRRLVLVEAGVMSPIVLAMFAFAYQTELVVALGIVCVSKIVVD